MLAVIILQLLSGFKVFSYRKWSVSLCLHRQSHFKWHFNCHFKPFQCFDFNGFRFLNSHTTCHMQTIIILRHFNLFAHEIFSISKSACFFVLLCRKCTKLSFRPSATLFSISPMFVSTRCSTSFHGLSSRWWHIRPLAPFPKHTVSFCYWQLDSNMDLV